MMYSIYLFLPKLASISLTLLITATLVSPIAILQASAQTQPTQSLEAKASHLFNQGIEQFRTSKFQAALQSWQEVLVLAREIGDQQIEAATLGNLGLVQEMLGNYSQAVDLQQQALRLSREIRNTQIEVNTLGHLGNIYFRRAQYSQAIDFYRQQQAIASEIQDHQTEVSAMGNLGVVLQTLGQYSQAIRLHQEGLALARALRDRQEEANFLGNLGLDYFNLEQYQQAIEFHKQHLAIAKDLNDRQGEALALNDLGEAYRKLKQYQEAVEAYTQSLEIAREIGYRQGEATSLGNLGLTFAALEQFQEALMFHLQALAIKREIGDWAGEGTTLGEIAQVWESQNQPGLAILFYKQAVNITEGIRQDIREFPALQRSYINSVAETYRRLADLLLQQDRVLEAQQVLDLLKVQELDDYLRGVRGTGQQVAFLRPEQEILAKYNALQQSVISLGQERSKLQQRLSQGESLSATEQQRLDQLLQLEAELNQQFNQFSTSQEIVALLDQLSPSVSRQSVPLEDLAALQDDLKTLNAVLLYPLVLEDRLELVITTPNSAPLRRTVPVSKVDLNQAILAFRQALQNPTSNATQPAQQLYDWLIKPIEADLAEANVKTIIYAPDGQLRYIPLAALYDGNQWLVQHYRINNITAKSLTNLDRQPATQPHILAGAFADPNITYDVPVGQQQYSFQGLPFAGQEVTNLISSFPDTTSLVDQAFSLIATQRSMNAANILHLATHAAFVSGAPENSFILFGNGDRSTLTDIGSWSLQNVDLVVLSACETGLGGLGNGEEILGLGYQFQVRGARAVIASLWSVGDGGTQALMTTFYAALQNQESKTEALREAQIALITGNYEALEDQSRGIVGIRQRIQAGIPTQVMSHLSHPYYWAPFILIGNGL